MRSKEFIPETKLHGTYGKVDPNVSDPLPGAFVQRDLRNTDPYMQYRYGLALAAGRAKAVGDVDFQQESMWAENLGIVAYSAEDEETIKLADKMMGVTGTRIADRHSKEAPGANTVSPVSNWMKKK
jgi:hypothetical protein